MGVVGWIGELDGGRDERTSRPIVRPDFQQPNCRQVRNWTWWHARWWTSRCWRAWKLSIAGGLLLCTLYLFSYSVLVPWVEDRNQQMPFAGWALLKMLCCTIFCKSSVQTHLWHALKQLDVAMPTYQSEGWAKKGKRQGGPNSAAHAQSPGLLTL